VHGAARKQKRRAGRFGDPPFFVCVRAPHYFCGVPAPCSAITAREPT
jgi:hypothetical protein